MILVDSREHGTNEGMIDAYRGSRLLRRIRHIIHPRDTKDKRVLCYDPPPYAIDTIQISCMEYCQRCALVSHMRERHTIWNLRYLKCLLNVHDNAKGACTKRSRTILRQVDYIMENKRNNYYKAKLLSLLVFKVAVNMIVTLLFCKINCKIKKYFIFNKIIKSIRFYCQKCVLLYVYY